jgi:hypothetical protein
MLEAGLEQPIVKNSANIETGNAFVLHPKSRNLIECFRMSNLHLLGRWTGIRLQLPWLA